MGGVLSRVQEPVAAHCAIAADLAYVAYFNKDVISAIRIAKSNEMNSGNRSLCLCLKEPLS